MMEDSVPAKEDEKKHRGARLLGKLFKQEQKPSSDVEVEEFLHGPSDKLHMLPTVTETPKSIALGKINTISASRWPSAITINTLAPTRETSSNHLRSRKKLVVRFLDGPIEVIGEGGEAAITPVSAISRGRQAPIGSPSLVPQRNPALDEVNISQIEYGTSEYQENNKSFNPKLLSRTQVDHSSTGTGVSHEDEASIGSPGTVRGTSSTELDRGSREKPFVQRMKTESRSEEGLALLRAASRIPVSGKTDTRSDEDDEEVPELSTQLRELHACTLNDAAIPPSLESSERLDPRGLVVYPKLQDSQQLYESPIAISRTSPPNVSDRGSAGGRNTFDSSGEAVSLSANSSLSLQETAVALGDEALHNFSVSVEPMFKLFHLSAEATKPLSQCSLGELIRASLWWFLLGRLNLEATIPKASNNYSTQQANLRIRQQAYADLAKSLWIIYSVTSAFPEVQLGLGSPSSQPQLVDLLESRQAIMSGLRKLAMSMKRNKFLPPDASDGLLVSGLNLSILPHDDGEKTLLASHGLLDTILLSQALPLGDTADTFCFGRYFVSLVVNIQGIRQQHQYAVLLSMVRDSKENGVKAIITSQDGCLNFVVQSNDSDGLTWVDVKWLEQQNVIDIHSPQGFTLRLICSKSDFTSLWAMHDYERSIHRSMMQRADERLLFETNVHTFQFFGQTTHPNFTQERQPQCQVRLYEKFSIAKSAASSRTIHRGLRICLVTSPKTKILRGIDRDLPTALPTHLGFLRGETDLPAIMVTVLGAGSADTMIFTFSTVDARTEFHTLLTGVSVARTEDTVAEATLKGFEVTAREDLVPPCFKSLDWQGYRIITNNCSEHRNHIAIPSEQLRLAIHFKVGTMVDRLNVSLGELRIRLDVSTACQIKVLRQPQEDLSITIDSHAPKDLAKQMTVFLDIIKSSATTRTYTFPSKADLHLFQGALTGFVVLFDEIATSFNISRRRMVVPIHKRWEATNPRLQVVRKDNIIQLLAFFGGFSHGSCMNFVLKSTDVFEMSNRGGKYSLRIIDAKFAMPEPSKGYDHEHDFVCLDMPEYPGEHDDITIMFEDERCKYQAPGSSLEFQD